MIINPRGTSGSGKSHLIRSIMALYDKKEPRMVEGRKQPIGYTLTSPGKKPLYVVGHYETACGGGDTIPAGIEVVYGYVREAVANGMDVLYEGLVVQNDVTRAIDLCRKNPGEHIVILLKTPLDECIRSVEQRRAARGNDKPLDPKNTERSFKSTYTQRIRFKDAGVNWQHLSREEAFNEAKRLLGWV